MLSPECEQAFRELKERLTTSPVFAYPNFSRDFVLETDASVQGIGAVLSQRQDDQRLHPIAYASRDLSPVELLKQCTLKQCWSLRVAASPQKDDIVSTADPCLSTEPMEFGGALKASAPEKAKTLDPGATSSDSTKPQETCVPVTKCLEDSSLPLTPRREGNTTQHRYYSRS